MITKDFKKVITSKQILENINKMFNIDVKLENYTREQLEDIRNKLRTKVFQHEGQSGINELLTNETYQKDKAMLDLINTRIKEMLGENIKQLKDKLANLNEAKKSKAEKDYDGNGKVESPKDEVWGSRAKAAAKAGKPFKESEVDENRVVKGPRYGGSKQKYDDLEKTDTAPKGSSEKTAADRAKDKAIDAKHAKDGKDWEKRGYKRTVVKGKAQSGSKDDDENVEESTGDYSAKKARAGKDIGKPGKQFAKIAKSAAKKYGSEETGKKVAGAVLAKLRKESYSKNVKYINESIEHLLKEDEEEKANVITAAGDIANDFTSWMQRVGQYQTKVMIEITDEIRHNFGQAEAEAFKQSVSPALTATLETLTAQREAISNAISVLAGESVPEVPMGQEPAQEQPVEEPVPMAEPDQMNTSDEFSASDAAAGEGPSGREVRENTLRSKLEESHSIISKLAK
jgi:hypothetical protein